MTDKLDDVLEQEDDIVTLLSADGEEVDFVEIAGIALDGLTDITAKETTHTTIKNKQPIKPIGNFFITVIHFLSVSFINRLSFILLSMSQFPITILFFGVYNTTIPPNKIGVFVALYYFVIFLPSPRDFHQSLLVQGEQHSPWVRTSQR